MIEKLEVEIRCDPRHGGEYECFVKCPPAIEIAQKLNEVIEAVNDMKENSHEI